MLKKQTLSGSTAWYSAGNLLIRTLSFLLLPLYSNHLTSAEFGNYSLLISLYTVISVLFQAGLQSALTKFYIDQNTSEKRNVVFSTLFFFLLALSSLLIFIALIFSEKLSFVIFDTDLSSLINLIFITIFIETVAFFFLHLLKTEEQSKKVVLFTSISAMLNFLLNFLFVFYLKLKVEGILISQLISSAVLLIFLFPSIRSKIKYTFDSLLIKKAVIFILPIVFANLFTSAVDVIDRFIINIYSGIDDVGLYSFNYRIAMIMYVFIISFRTAWIPYAINLHNEKKYEVEFGKIFSKLMAAGILIFLSVSLFADDLFDIKFSGINLFNPEYKNGIIILPYILSAYLISGIAAFYSFYPYIKGKSSIFLVSDLIAFLVNGSFNFILIPEYGMIGAAVATVFAYAGSSTYLYFISRNSTRIIYEWKKIIVIVFAGICLFLSGNYFNNIFSDIIFTILLILVIQFTLKIKFGNYLNPLKDIE